MSELAKHPLRLFYCYAHEDKTLRDTLDRHLSGLKRQKLLEIWYDGEISPSMDWEHEIDKHLSSADIVLLLVSADFLDSEYCYGKEMARALQRHKEGTARVIPIILRPVDWEDAPFSTLQVLPTEAKPVTRWMNPDDAYEDITKALRVMFNDLQSSRENVAFADEWYQKGENFKNAKQYEKAIEACEKAIRLNPDDAVVYYLKGFTLSKLSYYKEASAAFSKASSLVNAGWTG